MALSNDIVLRPRFKFDLSINNEILVSAFEAQKNKQTDFVVTQVDDHVFIRFPKTEQHYWSPQLHLEINTKDDTNSTIHGLFGPNPTVWTLFMFLHFLVAVLFFAFGIWTYTSITLQTPYAIPLFLTFLTVVFWFLLYAIGRLGKTKAQEDMHRLNAFMKEILQQFDDKAISY